MREDKKKIVPLTLTLSPQGRGDNKRRGKVF
jgi:hypothetical protein